jgi:peptide methionine sulfoxide reductase MsrA
LLACQEPCAHLLREFNDHHQQYLEKNPGGYCGIGPNGMSCPVGIPTV